MENIRFSEMRKSAKKKERNFAKGKVQYGKFITKPEVL